MPVPIEYRKEYFKRYRETHREVIRGYNNAYAKRKRDRLEKILDEFITKIKKRRNHG